MGLYTTWIFSRSYESFKNQPLEGKRVLYIAWVAFFINFIMSLILALILASMVYILIFDYFYLFLFNIIFCFLISIRWFDFSFKFFQNQIFTPINTEIAEKRFFVTCRGFKGNSNFGTTQKFMDAGILKLKKNHADFGGTFISKIFKSDNIFQIEKKSSEKIKIHTHSTNNQEPNIFIISLKDHFYPFRSRANRDAIFRLLSSA
ncbi:MAG: hypothetical protein HOK41_12155 [Nitrospina sp.]|nr:hypothetical protein [Nitrospina sp.]MBT6718646.1 hypothetical protein [Nitrospina sp.]